MNNVFVEVDRMVGTIPFANQRWLSPKLLATILADGMEEKRIQWVRKKSFVSLSMKAF